jgi:hypothetical protein
MEGKKRVIPQKLPKEVYQALENNVGEDYISKDRAIIETYSKYSVDPRAIMNPGKLCF